MGHNYKSKFQFEVVPWFVKVYSIREVNKICSNVMQNLTRSVYDPDDQECSKVCALSVT